MKCALIPNTVHDKHEDKTCKAELGQVCGIESNTSRDSISHQPLIQARIHHRHELSMNVKHGNRNTHRNTVDNLLIITIH